MLLKALGTGGSLVTDTQLAALAWDHPVVIHNCGHRLCLIRRAALVQSVDRPSKWSHKDELISSPA